MSNSLLLHLGASIYQKYRSTLGIVDPFGDGSGLALYNFDGDAQDAGGLYNGTATNVTYSLGKFNSSTQHVADWVVAAYSNNISSGVSIPSNFLTNKTALTISMWVYSQDTTQPTILTGFDYRGSRLFGCSIIKSSTADYFGLGVQFSASSIMMWSGGNNNSDHVLFSSFAMPLNQWVHFTLVFSGASTSWKVYANSVLVATFTHATFTITGTSNVLDRTYFGCSGYTQISSGDKYDQVRIFNRALTSTEVTALYMEE